MANDASYQIKEFLPDNLTLVRSLGRSPLSEVFLVHDKDDVFFALKVLRASVAKDPRVVERWKREAQTLLELEHSNLLRCFDTYTIDGRPALLLEYVSGCSLRHP
nr:hypothetical protein [Planctomycetota bacterium]